MIKLLLITTAYAYLEFLFLNSKFIKIYRWKTSNVSQDISEF